MPARSGGPALPLHAVPTLSEWGSIVLALGLGALVFLRSRTMG